MKKIIALLLVVASLFAFAGCGEKADSDSAYIKDKGELVIGYTLFAPMNYYDKENNFIGFETEFAKAVCEKVGVTPKFVEINWDSKEVELNAKNIDCIWNGLTITDERKANQSLSTPYLNNRQVLIVKKENVSKYNKSVGTAAISVEQGSAGEELTAKDELFKDAKVTPVDSQAKAVMEVEAGLADVAIADYVMAMGTIGEGTDYADLTVIDDYKFASEEYGIAFRKGSDFTEEVNKAISELREDGTLLKIADKYKLKDLYIKD